MNIRPPYRYVDPVVEARLSLYADDRSRTWTPGPWVAVGPEAKPNG